VPRRIRRDVKDQTEGKPWYPVGGILPVVQQLVRRAEAALLQPEGVRLGQEGSVGEKLLVELGFVPARVLKARDATFLDCDFEGELTDKRRIIGASDELLEGVWVLGFPGEVGGNPHAVLVFAYQL